MTWSHTGWTQHGVFKHWSELKFWKLSQRKAIPMTIPSLLVLLSGSALWRALHRHRGWAPASPTVWTLQSRQTVCLSHHTARRRENRYQLYPRGTEEPLGLHLHLHRGNLSAQWPFWDTHCNFRILWSGGLQTAVKPGAAKSPECLSDMALYTFSLKQHHGEWEASRWSESSRTSVLGDLKESV